MNCRPAQHHQRLTCMKSSMRPRQNDATSTMIITNTLNFSGLLLCSAHCEAHLGWSRMSCGGGGVGVGVRVGMKSKIDVTAF